MPARQRPFLILWNGCSQCGLELLIDHYDQLYACVWWLLMLMMIMHVVVRRVCLFVISFSYMFVISFIYVKQVWNTIHACYYTHIHAFLSCTSVLLFVVRSSCLVSILSFVLSSVL